MSTDPEPMVVSGVNRELITRLSVPCVSEHSDKDNTFYQLMHTHTHTASFCLCKDNTFYQLMYTHTRTASFCLCKDNTFYQLMYKDNTLYQLMHTHTRTASFCLCICRCAEAIVTLPACCQGNE